MRAAFDLCGRRARHDGHRRDDTRVARRRRSIGFASGFISPAATSPALGTVDRRRAGVAAALNAARQSGSALGVAIFGACIATLQPFPAAMRVALGIATGLSALAADVVDHGEADTGIRRTGRAAANRHAPVTHAPACTRGGTARRHCLNAAVAHATYIATLTNWHRAPGQRTDARCRARGGCARR